MKFENTSVMNFENAIRGMRNPHDSWDKSDSKQIENNIFVLGNKDKELAISLIKGGSEHRKFLRQIFVSVDISAPLYWWKEFDTYKVGTVSNSCSTMHTITKYEFSLDMFECKELNDDGIAILSSIIDKLNSLRKEYLETKDKNIWKEIIILLPEWSTDFINWARSLPYAQEFIFTDEIDK